MATSPPEPSVSALTVTASAHRVVVSRVGPSAAAALVAVALRAETQRRGPLLARVSARALAVDLGVAKDTAAGALGLLVRAGYLEHLAQPRVAGRFAPARYRLRLPRGFTAVPCPGSGDTVATATERGDAAASAPTQPGPRASRPRGPASQLGLFPAVAGEPDTETTS